MSIENKNLKFVKYNENNLKQQSFITEIKEDKIISSYIFNLAQDVTKSIDEGANCIGFIAEDISINEYVGLCTIRSQGYDRDTLSIEYAVHSNYRNSEHKYGRNILRNLTNLLFETENFKKAVLEIKPENISSIKAAGKAGFTVDYELYEIFQNEGYYYIPYSKNNPYYKLPGVTKVKTK
ncbi:MAG: GNAT family protein [Bacilli bacterium]|nr:GNAT family protein [Bacilli bacterium]MDD3305041.1 GNAT family protein [Bacilli bacterium]MDD4053466.1 GNAT family protein [Bacilli bacterium]MDD4411764.1 GNAT family protein [Bacilli bacterium]